MRNLGPTRVMESRSSDGITRLFIRPSGRRRRAQNAALWIADDCEHAPAKLRFCAIPSAAESPMRSSRHKRRMVTTNSRSHDPCSAVGTGSNNNRKLPDVPVYDTSNTILPFARSYSYNEAFIVCIMRLPVRSMKCNRRHGLLCLFGDGVHFCQ